MVGSRSDEGTGAFTRGSYRYLYPAKAPAAMTATTATASHAMRERRLGRLLLAAFAPDPCRGGSGWSRPGGPGWTGLTGGKPRTGVRFMAACGPDPGSSGDQDA